MSPPWSSISLFLLLSFLPSSLAVICETCEGNECEGTCEGDYCVLSFYNPRFGTKSLLEKRTQVRGCLNGKMMAKNIKSKCIEVDGKDQMCICNTDNCTSEGKKKKKQLPRVEKEKVRCKCNAGKGCEQGSCEGDLCVWSSTGGKKATQGCMDLSLPLFERRAIDSCMMPPMVGSFHYLALGDTAMKDLMNTESCICSTKNCNSKKPVILTRADEREMETQKCQAFVNQTIRGKNYMSNKSACTGEFCFQMKVSTDGLGQLSSFHSEGCATFSKKAKLEREFREGDWADFNGRGLKVRAYYKTDNEESLKRLTEEEEEEEEAEDYENEGETKEEQEVAPNGKDERSNGKEEEETEEEREEEGDEEGDKGKEEKEGHNGNEEKQEEKTIGEAPKLTHTTKNFVFVAPTEAPTPDESNATMITVFVLIILCICVAGITWKFQLHRKLMRGNYDTVAGG